MFKIRRGIFETNSSSTHAICIANDIPADLPDKVIFKHKYFGWGYETFNTIEDRASYLYECICGLTENDPKERNRLLNYVTDALWKSRIACEFEDDTYDEIGVREGGIDHVDETIDFLKAILRSERKLKKFLFADSSMIVTGNDNDEEFELHRGELDDGPYDVIYEKYN